VPVDVPWRDLTTEQQSWVIEGEGDWNKKVWYGARRFFAWLETRAYKMHIRVLLSRYRSYTPCHVCNGARLKDEALLWRLGDDDDAARVIEPATRFRPGKPSGACGARRCRGSVCTISCCCRSSGRNDSSAPLASRTVRRGGRPAARRGPRPSRFLGRVGLDT
jgi:hypothetical protein